MPTCVGLGYGPFENSLEAFLGSMGSPYFASYGYASRLTLGGARICLGAGLHACTRTTNAWRSYPPASPHRLATTGSDPALATINPRKDQPWFGRLASPTSPGAHPHGYGNINPLSIDYA